MRTRRDFLRFMARAGAFLPFVNQAFITKAYASDPLVSLGDIQNNPDKNILVLIRLFGGNDGLNTLVPFQDKHYYTIRKEKAEINQAISPEDVLRLEGEESLGFHPRWAKMQTLFNEGAMSIIQNVGYEGQDLSHFRSTDIWLSASDATVFDETGWIGRYFENKYPGYPDTLPTAPFSIEFANSLTRITTGAKHQMGFGYTGKCQYNTLSNGKNGKNRRSAIEQEFIRQTMRVSDSFLQVLIDAEEAHPNNMVEYPIKNALADNLARAARLIAAGVDTRVYSLVSETSFDTHASHLPYHAEGLGLVADAVYAFQRDIEKMGVADRVVVMLYSEFGRRVAPNGSGLDHGAAAPIFLIGKQVSGKILGANPNLENLDANGNLNHETDFRQVYASLLEQWFGERVDGLHPVILPHALQTLPIIKASVGGDSMLSCYPNPCTTLTTIALRNEQVRSITAMNSRGQSINLPYSRDGIERITIDVRGLSAGAYYVFIRDGDSMRRASFVKL